MIGQLKGRQMGIEYIVLKQYQEKVNQAVQQFGGNSLSVPEGWLRTVRKALGMSGPQLAKRLGVTKWQVSKTEKGEVAGSVTLKTMNNMAEALNCRFVYAVIPEKEIEQVIKDQAIKKAKAQVKDASTHMALEAQALSKEKLNAEIARIASQIMGRMPSDLWNDE